MTKTESRILATAKKFGGFAIITGKRELKAAESLEEKGLVKITGRQACNVGEKHFINARIEIVQKP